MNLNTMPTTYSALSALLDSRGGDTDVPIANNTTAEYLLVKAPGADNDIVIRLHGHAIVLVHADGDVSVRHCGYATTTTFDRIKRFLPRGWNASRSGGRPRVERYTGNRTAYDLFSTQWVRVPAPVEVQS